MSKAAVGASVGAKPRNEAVEPGRCNNVSDIALPRGGISVLSEIYTPTHTPVCWRNTAPLAGVSAQLKYDQ